MEQLNLAGFIGNLLFYKIQQVRELIKIVILNSTFAHGKYTYVWREANLTNANRLLLLQEKYSQRSFGAGCLV